jgi:uncharacterized repeat protein (TIGR01451 family)
MHYTVEVTNNGPDVATRTAVVDALPPTVDFVSATPTQGTCVHDSGTITCDLGDVANGATASIDIAVIPRQAGVIRNIATVSTDTPDPEAGNDSSFVDTNICRITSRRSSIPCG